MCVAASDQVHHPKSSRGCSDTPGWKDREGRTCTQYASQNLCGTYRPDRLLTWTLCKPSAVLSLAGWLQGRGCSFPERQRGGCLLLVAPAAQVVETNRDLPETRTS